MTGVAAISVSNPKIGTSSVDEPLTISRKFCPALIHNNVSHAPRRAGRQRYGPEGVAKPGISACPHQEFRAIRSEIHDEHLLQGGWNVGTLTALNGDLCRDPLSAAGVESTEVDAGAVGDDAAHLRDVTSDLGRADDVRW